MMTAEVSERGYREAIAGRARLEAWEEEVGGWRKKSFGGMPERKEEFIKVGEWNRKNREG